MTHTFLGFDKIEEIEYDYLDYSEVREPGLAPSTMMTGTTETADAEDITKQATEAIKKRPLPQANVSESLQESDEEQQTELPSTDQYEPIDTSDIQPPRPYQAIARPGNGGDQVADHIYEN